MMRIHTFILNSIIFVGVFAVMLQCKAFSALSRPEGVEWHLAEAVGAPVYLPASTKQPYLLLDPVKKKVSGHGGCNNFFAGYELNGSSMKFGTLGATRMFCEGVPGEVEMRFMKALEQTRTWELRENMLFLLKDGKVLARFTIKKRYIQESDLSSMTFLSKWVPSGKVTLSHGEYHEPAASDSALEIIVKLSTKKVFGMVNGKETGAAVIFTSAGGTGTFYDLALLTNGAEGWVNTDTVLLGDRVMVHSVEIRDDLIAVAMTTHAPTDPLCCPTMEVKKCFAVREDRLVPITEGKTKEENQIIR